MKMPKKSILIFIITYFASFRLDKVYKKIPVKKILNKNFKVNILISDDGSKDDTPKIAKQIVKKNKNSFLNLNKKNLGYGGNIKFCLNYAIKRKYDYAVMLHGDNQYKPRYISEMINKILLKKNVAAICGSRMMKKKNALKGKMPIYKFVGNIILTKFFNLIFKTSFTDCHSGYWLYDLSYLKKIKLENIKSNFNFDNQLRISIIKKNYNIIEVPIKTYYGNERSSIHFLYAIRFFAEVFYYKFIKF
jgi:glycosyltransferase involved in cell wall biosynthesis